MIKSKNKKEFGKVFVHYNPTCVFPRQSSWPVIAVRQDLLVSKHIIDENKHIIDIYVTFIGICGCTC